MTRFFYLLCLLFLLVSPEMSSQYYSPDRIHLRNIPITELGGLQSYAYGVVEGEWVIIGGRLDGLHRRQPFAAFDQAGHNNNLIVVDPATQQSWSAPLAPLPTNIREQLSATNALFHQEGTQLYVVGGYGYSPSEQDHTTFPYLTIVDLDGLIPAIKEGADITPFFQQVTNNSFQITGGRMGKLGDVFYLVGGQKFIGRYNPMGPNNGPGFIQEYTNKVSRFTIEDNDGQLVISVLPSWQDEEQLHRRDYNLFPQIFPDGKEGYTAFSGVFRYDADLPFLNSVDIDSDGYSVNYDFLQYFNHYHCAGIPLYSEATNEMHTLFFGGIAQFYLQNGERIRDDEVPFVKTIARVSRNAAGEMQETVLPLELPAYLGAGAEFIMAPDLPLSNNGVIRIDDLPETDSLLLGYIYGGIRSQAANIFFINNGSQSIATSGVMAVYLLGEAVNSTPDIAAPPKLQMSLYPNPVTNELTLEFELPRFFSKIDLEVVNAAGKLVYKTEIRDLGPGAQQFLWVANQELTPGTYLLSLSNKGKRLGSTRFIYGN